MVVTAGSADECVAAVAAEAVIMGQPGRTMVAAGVVAGASVAAAIEVVAQSGLAVKIAELEDAVVLFETDFVAIIVVGPVEIVSAAVVSEEGQIAALFVAEAVFLLIKMQSEMNSYQMVDQFDGIEYCLQAIAAVVAESIQAVVAYLDLANGQQQLHCCSEERIVRSAVAAVTVVTGVAAAGAAAAVVPGVAIAAAVTVGLQKLVIIAAAAAVGTMQLEEIGQLGSVDLLC